MSAASSPPDVLPAPAPAPAEAVAVLSVEPPVAADAGMAKVPLLEVVSDLPSLGTDGRPLLVAENEEVGKDHGQRRLSHPDISSDGQLRE